MLETLGRAKRFRVPYCQCGNGYSVRLLRGGWKLSAMACELIGGVGHDKLVPAVPEIDFYCIDEEWNLLCLVLKMRYWAREHNFEKPILIRHNLLVAWHNEAFL